MIRLPKVTAAALQQQAGSRDIVKKAEDVIEEMNIAAGATVEVGAAVAVEVAVAVVATTEIGAVMVLDIIVRIDETDIIGIGTGKEDMTKTGTGVVIEVTAMGEAGVPTADIGIVGTTGIVETTEIVVTIAIANLPKANPKIPQSQLPMLSHLLTINHRKTQVMLGPWNPSGHSLMYLTPRDNHVRVVTIIIKVQAFRVVDKL